MAFTPFSFIIYMLLSSLLVIAASGHGTVPGPNLGDNGEKFLSVMIGVQGIIYCKSGGKLIPIEGAVARITCETVDEYGYEAAPLSILSEATDEKGYFLATLSPLEVKNDKLRVKSCRAYLELSPLETCNVPTEINRGISGALLTSYRLLENQMKLFTVRPFVFAPEETQDKSIPDGY